MAAGTAGSLGAMEPDIVADSVTDALAQLVAPGYRGDFSGRAGAVHCSACHDDHGPERAQVDRVYRYEGPSDPDEQAIVLALSCPVCGAKGTLECTMPMTVSGSAWPLSKSAPLANARSSSSR